MRIHRIVAAGGRLALAAALLFTLVPGVRSQAGAGRGARPLPAREGAAGADALAMVVARVAGLYREGTPAEQVKRWGAELSAQPIDQDFRSSVLIDLSIQFGERRLMDRRLLSETRAIIEPVLDLYGRGGECEIFLVRSGESVVGYDSGVALIISTGLLRRARSEDEIQGLVAHEVGHGLHAARFVRLKSQHAPLVKLGLSAMPEARALEAELQKIELACDAFAARTMLALGRNPFELARFLARVEEGAGGGPVKTDAAFLYPSAKDRGALIGLLADRAGPPPARRTDLLTTLQQRLAAYDEGER